VGLEVRERMVEGSRKGEGMAERSEIGVWFDGGLIS